MEVPVTTHGPSPWQGLQNGKAQGSPWWGLQLPEAMECVCSLGAQRLRWLQLSLRLLGAAGIQAGRCTLNLSL